MQRRTWFLLVSLVVFGCTPSLNNEISTPSGTTAVPSSIVQSTLTIPSPTPEPATQSLTQLEAKQDCIEIGTVAQRNAEGVLVFQKDQGSRLILMDSQMRSLKFVPGNIDDKVWRAYVSPDGKWLIYELDWGDPNGETKFVLTNANGSQYKEMPFNGDWISNDIFWLSNSYLRVSEWDIQAESVNNFAFDPSTEVKVALKSDFPDIATKGVDWGIDRPARQMGLFRGTNIVYDPTLTHVLYPKNNNSVSLFNLETDQEITQLSISGQARLPKWSPSGSEVAIIGTVSNLSNDEIHDELIIVSRDGTNIRRLSFPSSFSKKLHIENYSWSPNSQKIALWLETDNNEATTVQNPLELAVLDVAKNKVLTHCISGTSAVEHETYTNNINIIWSPDSAYLLIVRYSNESNKNTEEVIVDLSRNTAYRVAENMEPIGWMIGEP